jgi:hypothetical protein
MRGDGTRIPGKTTRPWRVVAAEVTKEKDSTKLTKLVEELNRALEEQGGLNLQRHDKQEKPG